MESRSEAGPREREGGPSRRVFRVWHVALATAVGGPLAAGAVLGLNERRLGHSSARALGLLVVGAVGGVAFVLARWMTFPRWWIPIYLAAVLGMLALARFLQGPAIKEHVSMGGELAPGSGAFLLGVGGIAVSAVAAFGTIFLGVAIRGPVFWQYVMMLQPRTVYGSCDMRGTHPTAADQLGGFVTSDEQICFEATFPEAAHLCHHAWSTAPCDRTRVLGSCWSSVGSWWWYPSSAIKSPADVKRACEAGDRVFRGE
jgi:hypothetical protein